MSMIKIPFISGAYESRSISIDCQRCINLYPEKETFDSKNVSALIGTPGMKFFSSATEPGINRGIYATSTGLFFQIRGNSICQINSEGRIVHHYTPKLLTTTGPVKMADNGIQMIIVDGSYGYVLRLDGYNSVSVIENFPNGATHVIFKDGYFVAHNPNVSQYNFYWSKLYDGETWDPLDVSSAEGSPDKLIALAKTNNEIWCFGEQTTEVFANTGDQYLVFARVNGAFFDIGTKAKYSVSTNGNSVFWLGSNAQGNNIVWMATGYSPQRISNHAIEYIIGNMATTEDAMGYCYQQEGHSFYVLTFQNGNTTLVFDMATGMWHERTSYNNQTNETGRHRALYHAFFNDKNIVGDYLSNYLYELSLDYGYEQTTADDFTGDLFGLNNRIIRTRSTPHIHKFNKRLFYNSLEIDMQKGTGVTTDNVYDPVFDGWRDGKVTNNIDPHVMLRYSNDGGFTWSNQVIGSIGKKGEYSNRIKFNRLGMARDRVFEISTSYSGKVVFIDALADVTVES